MITSQITKEQLIEYRKLYDTYKNQLFENRVSGDVLLKYIKDNYCVKEVFDKTILNVITDNILMNDIYKEKLPKDKLPNPKCFYIEDDKEILVGIDTITGFFYVEGSSMLFDKLNAIRGLDNKDLTNYVIVGEYIQALIRFNMLNRVIHKKGANR